MTDTRTGVRRSFFLAGLLGLAGLAGWAAEPVKESPPDNSGPIKLLAASWLGGAYDDEVVAADVAPDSSILLAGNSVDLRLAGVKPTVFGELGAIREAPAAREEAAPEPPPKGKKPRAPKPAAHERHPSTFGFILRLPTDGKKVLSYSRFGHGVATIQKMKLGPDGNVYVLGDSPQGLEMAGVSGKGTFVARLTPDAGKVLMALYHPDAHDFGIDAGGEVVVLSGAKMTRYPADGKTPKWTVSWAAHGANRPGGMVVSPSTGVAAVVGYGMTRTGHEPYKDPYGYGFDREGKPLWSLWNPDPKGEAAAKYGGNGLMADTTGRGAFTDARGDALFFVLYADGGNTVCTRDPADPDKPLASSVFEGVFQKGPGHGFRGASSTAVVFRIDPRTGALQKGTWMSAWLNPAHANALSMTAAAGDDRGRVFVAGNSASGCPTKLPWYTAKEPDGYKGGGFLAALDRDFQMIQCGYFPAASINCIGARNGYVVIGGAAKEFEDKEGTTPARLYRPLQDVYGGGDHDGYFALFEVGAGVDGRSGRGGS